MNALCPQDMPRVVLSLDFELRWGVHDQYGLERDGYRAHLEGERHVVPPLLDLFVQHGLRVTWATVGAIGCANWEEYFQRAPPAPRYENPAFAVRPEYADLDPDGTLHFAPEAMRAIADAAGQALGTHTFSHLFFREAGVTAEDVAADLAAVVKLHEERFQRTPRSLVFPRNQPAFIDVVRASPVRVWRGNPDAWYYECEDSRHNGPLPRALKLVDSFNPLSRRACSMQGDMTRASLFLRLGLPGFAWNAHLRRIRAEIDALPLGQIFHLWFHPHNVGSDTALRLTRVRQVAEIIAEAQARGRLLSCSMEDLIQ